MAREVDHAKGIERRRLTGCLPHPGVRIHFRFVGYGEKVSDSSCERTNSMRTPVSSG
jgi:hypothetical protein